MHTIILLLIVAASVAITDAHACSCSSYPDFLEVWMDSDGAFQGTVKDVFTGDGPRKVLFDIHHVQKGSYPHGEYLLEDSSIIYGDDGTVMTSSCEVYYKIGETYQVFAYGEDSLPSGTNVCSTKQISGFNERSREDDNGQIQHYVAGYNFFTQYSLFSLIVPVSLVSVITGIVVWRTRK